MHLRGGTRRVGNPVGGAVPGHGDERGVVARPGDDIPVAGTLGQGRQK